MADPSDAEKKRLPPPTPKSVSKAIPSVPRTTPPTNPPPLPRRDSPAPTPAAPLPVRREPSVPVPRPQATTSSAPVARPSPPPPAPAAAAPPPPPPAPAPAPAPARPAPPPPMPVPRSETSRTELFRRDTTELPAFDEEDLDDPPAPPPEPALAPEARAVIATCESELETNPPPPRAARLHYEIARAYETAVGWAEQAASHYQQALDGAPDYIPAIRGARRAALARGDHDAALLLFDAEERLTAAPRKKAMLFYHKGRVLEDAARDAARARVQYARALELDPANASVLKALEQCDREGTGDVAALLVTIEQQANAVAGDARHRAALLVERARLVARQPDSARKAAELYEAALKLDPHALGALDALERIYRRERAWRDLATTLERRARDTTGARRALALYRAARIHDERLGQRTEAIAALGKAADAAPGDPLVLGDLARAYEDTGDHEALSGVLATLVALATDARQRVVLLFRLGQLLEGPLGEPDAAIARYQEALELDPTNLPVLLALGELLASRKQWGELIEMLLGEADSTGDAQRAADAHARVAELFEVHLRDPAQAAAHHARALSLVPGFALAFKALLRLYVQLGRYRELAELLERAVAEASLRSLKIAYLMKIGSIWEDSLVDPVQALHAYKRVRELDPDDLVAIHAVQRVAERAERYQELVDALEREVELVDERAHKVGLLHRAGTVFDDHLRDEASALARFSRALELDAAYAPALARVARIYYRGGRWQDLIAIHERQLPLLAGDTALALRFEMGELCETKLADTAGAIAWYKRALETDRAFQPALRALVRLLLEQRDWAELVRVLELEAEGLANPLERAVALFRIGTVCEEWLEDDAQAIAAYRRALAAREDYRPARVALARLYGESGEWMQLIDLLGKEAAATDDPGEATSVLMRQAEVYRDELRDADLATHCVEAVAQHAVGVVPALLALEPLYATAESWPKLAGVYAEMAKQLADPGARIAALRELARLQELQKLGTPRERVATYQRILEIDRDDESALAALEDLGRQHKTDRVLVDAYRRLADVSENDTVAAAFLTDLGQALERSADRQALDAYKDAVKRDPGSLTAIRGLARVGDLTNNPRAMAQAARLEAELTRRPEIAAKLFVRSGILRREQMNDLGAVEDFERALEVWPDDTQGAERIIQPLVDTGQVVRLIDILSKTATLAKSPERRTALWLEVGGLYARRLDDLGAGITAYKRALEATPGHVVALARLGEAYHKNRQWGDAVATYEQLLALTSDDAVRADAHLRLAAIFDEHLRNPERAGRCVEAVLRHDPKHAGALLRLADIQLRAGNEAEAVATTQRLVDLAASPKEKGAALVRIAKLHRMRNDTAAADAALAEALSLEGPGGDAERELKKAIAGHGNWAGYAAGLAAHIKRAASEHDAVTIAPAYLELAKTYAEGMALPNRAIEALTEGIAATQQEPALVIAAGRRLREAGRYDEALQYLDQAVATNPLDAEVWRELATTFEQAGRRDDAARAHVGLAIARGERPTAGLARPASAAELSFDAKAIASLAVDNCMGSPVASLLASVADGICKLYPPSLERYGITSRDRVGAKSGTPVWELAMRVAKIFGAELELYEHAAAKPIIAVEPFELPALVVSQALRRLPVGQQVFLLAYAIGPIASRLHAALSLRSIELELALVGAVRLIVPAFSLRGASPEVDDAKELLRKAQVRKWRRQLEVSAAEVAAASPPPDIARWRSAVLQTALRTALLVSDDLGATLDALPHVIELPDGDARGTDVVRDLLALWPSARAAAVRRRAGMAV